MASSAPLMNTPPGIFSGRPEMSSCSLPNAMFEPQKEIEPTIAAKTSGMPSSSSVRSPPCSRNSAHAMSAIAPPPTPLNSATICGIAVIFTLRAAGTPMTVPITMPSAISPQLPMSSRSSVAMTATAMPTAAMRLPRTAVVGLRQLRQAGDEQREGDDVEEVDDVADPSGLLGLRRACGP